jgi:hypothetical protein
MPPPAVVGLWLTAKCVPRRRAPFALKAASAPLPTLLACGDGKERDAQVVYVVRSLRRHPLAER